MTASPPLLIAQTAADPSPEPTRLVGIEDPAPTVGPWVALTIASITIMLASSAVALAILRTKRIDARPHELAFRSLARTLGVSRSQRRTLRRLAERIDAQPAALLVSPAALARARELDPSKHTEALVERLNTPRS